MLDMCGLLPPFCFFTFFLSPDEAGRYLETYKSYEKKPADLLKEQVEKDYLSKVCSVS